MKEKIAFVVVRYGKNINGGAEYHCRMLAERLTDNYDVEVLTTCVNDYVKGDNDIPEGTEVDNGVLVRRFKVAPLPPKNTPHREMKWPRRIRRFLNKIHLLRWFSYVHPIWGWQRDGEIDDMRWNVFNSPNLYQFLREHKNEYCAIIPITIDWPLTYYTAMIAGEKCICIPTMHDHKVSYRGILTEAFSRFAYVGFNTKAEQRLGVNLFGRALHRHGIVSVSIEDQHPADWKTTKQKYGLPDRYITYVGRVDHVKIEGLTEAFATFKQMYPKSPLKLVMVGGIFEKPKLNSDDIVYTGFVDKADKEAIILNSVAVVNPSRYESLSLILLEALSLGRPILVNGHCAVLKGHCKKSGYAADYYMNPKQFARKLHRLESSDELWQQRSESGKRYVEENYNWPLIMGRLRKVIESMPRNEKN